MSKPFLTAISLTLLHFGLLFGCQGEKTSAAATSTTAVLTPKAAGGVYAKVNDVELSNNYFQAYVKARRAIQANDQNLTDEAIADEFITGEVLRQKAVNMGIGQRPEVIGRIRYQKMGVLVNTLMTEKFAELDFTEAQLRAEYDRFLDMSDFEEYKARHILLQSEEDAKAVIEELKAGANFETLAKTESKGPSAPNGGDLGWFKANTMVAPFAATVREMEIGAYSTEAVNTRFGWHVILLEDVRTITKPTYESVKQDLRETLLRQNIQNYVDELKAEATIVHSNTISGTPDPEETGH